MNNKKQVIDNQKFNKIYHKIIIKLKNFNNNNNNSNN